MNVKIEQWTRVDNNLYKVVKLYEKRFIAQAIDHKRRFNYKNIILIADTPLELIDIDTDLICGFKEDKPLSIDVKHNDCFQCGDRYVEFKDVAKILTPNSEGGYDLQYKI